MSKDTPTPTELLTEVERLITIGGTPTGGTPTGEVGADDWTWWGHHALAPLTSWPGALSAVAGWLAALAEPATQTRKETDAEVAERWKAHGLAYGAGWRAGREWRDRPAPTDATDLVARLRDTRMSDYNTAILDEAANDLEAMAEENAKLRDQLATSTETDRPTSMEPGTEITGRIVTASFEDGIARVECGLEDCECPDHELPPRAKGTYILVRVPDTAPVGLWDVKVERVLAGAAGHPVVGLVE